MSKSPLDEIQWKSPEWIQQFGLHSGNVLDYFSESPFYDRTSNNQVLRMQLQFQPVPAGVHPQKHFLQKLGEMKGVEFVVAYSREPDFWIIRKQRRVDTRVVKPLEDYYIIGANVYQAPKVYDILSSRLLATVLSIQKLMELLNSTSRFEIEDGGHSYPRQDDEDVDTGVGLAVPATNSVAGTPAPTPAINTGTVNVTSTDQIPTSSMFSSEVLAAVFDNLLNDTINSANSGTYIDDIPYYGKGSTVEMLGVKLSHD